MLMEDDGMKMDQLRYLFGMLESAQESTVRRMQKMLNATDNQLAEPREGGSAGGLLGIEVGSGAGALRPAFTNNRVNMGIEPLLPKDTPAFTPSLLLAGDASNSLAEMLPTPSEAALGQSRGPYHNDMSGSNITTSFMNPQTSKRDELDSLHDELRANSPAAVAKRFRSNGSNGPNLGSTKVHPEE